MGIKEIVKQDCSLYTRQMCMSNDQDIRNCPLPRCCAICPKKRDCDGLCSPIKEIFANKKQEVNK